MPTSDRPWCCLCWKRCTNPARRVPVDAHGNVRLPPKAEAFSVEAARPPDARPSKEDRSAAEDLGNQTGHWCYNKVCTENKEIRERGTRALRGAFAPADAPASVLADREPREERNLREDSIDDVDFDNSSLPLALSTLTSPGAGTSAAGKDKARADTGARSRTASFQLSEVEPYERGGAVRQAIAVQKAKAEGREYRPRGKQSLSARVDPGSHTNDRFLQKEELKVREARLLE